MELRYRPPDELAETLRRRWIAETRQATMSALPRVFCVCFAALGLVVATWRYYLGPFPAITLLVGGVAAGCGIGVLLLALLWIIQRSGQARLGDEVILSTEGIEQGRRRRSWREVSALVEGEPLEGGGGRVVWLLSTSRAAMPLFVGSDPAGSEVLALLRSQAPRLTSGERVLLLDGPTGISSAQAGGLYAATLLASLVGAALRAAVWAPGQLLLPELTLALLLGPGTMGCLLVAPGYLVRNSATRSVAFLFNALAVLLALALGSIILGGSRRGGAVLTLRSAEVHTPDDGPPSALFAYTCACM